MNFIQDFTAVEELLTPTALLEMEELPEAKMILPPDAQKFEDLLKVRNSIRNLRLLPIKDEQSRQYYHNSVDQKKEHESLLARMADNKIGVEINKFPYLLPPDVAQWIIWIKPEASRLELLYFIASSLVNQGISSDKVILFERPAKTKTLLVRGTFPHMRHIHFWTEW